MLAEVEGENVSKIVAATVREIVGDPGSSVSVNTLTTADGILNMTHAVKQECDDCLWVKADTGATDESVSLRSKAVKRSKQLGDLAEKTFIDTLMTEGEIVCVAPAQDLNPVDRNDNGHGCVGPATQEEKKMLDVSEDYYCKVTDPQEENKMLNVPINGFCKEICDDDHFFECNENDESDDFDANTVLLTVHLVMRDFETTVMDAMDVETSFGELCKKWGLAIQNEVQSLREHDARQEMTEEERWTVLSKGIIPGESVFTIKSENTKKAQIVGSGNFQDDAGMAVSFVNVTVMTVRVLMLIASVAGLFVIGVHEQTAPLHASLYGQEDDCVRPPLLLSQLEFN